MAAELRWILIACSALLLAGIWWWGARRSRQAPGNAELREPTQTPAVMAARAPEERDSAGRDWGPSPLEPLSIRTAGFEEVQIHDMSMTAHAEPFDEQAVLSDDLETTIPTLTPPVELETVASADPGAPRAAEPAAAAPSGQPARNGSEMQRIVSIRVCAAGEGRWSGTDLKSTLEDHGLAYGRYSVFHRKHSDGRTLFCAASLVEPGTFNLATMPDEQFRGLTLFAVLPGPIEPLQTVDALIESAGQLAQSLRGTVQDAAGLPFSEHRAAALREDIERFQALLTMT